MGDLQWNENISHNGMALHATCILSRENFKKSYVFEFPNYS